LEQTKQTQMEELVNDIEKHTPALLLGDAVKDFIKQYDGKIDRVRNIDDVREIVSYYMNLPNLDRILVIEGLSFLNRRASFMLLKLVEESTLSIILLSRFDNVSEIILSRIKTIIKYKKSKTKSEFLNIESGVDVVREKLSDDSHYYDELKYYSKFSPILYYIKSNINVERNKDKIMSILS